MNKMKAMKKQFSGKWCCWIVSVFLLVNVFPVFAYEDPTITVSSGSANYGQTVPIKISTNSSKSIAISAVAGIQFDIVYDSNALSVQESGIRWSDEITTGNWGVYQKKLIEPGTIRILIANDVPRDVGNICTIDFSVLSKAQEKDYDIKIENAGFYVISLGSGWVEIPETKTTNNSVINRTFSLNQSYPTQKVKFISDEDGLVRVKEIEIFAEGSEENIAKNKSVISDSSYTANGINYTPDKAVDGEWSEDTSKDSFRWISANTADQHYLEIDLGRQYNVNKIVLRTGGGQVSPVSEFRFQYDLQSSLPDNNGKPMLWTFDEAEGKIKIQKSSSSDIDNNKDSWHPSKSPSGGSFTPPVITPEPMPIPSVPANSMFSDIPESLSWARESIETLTDKVIIQGSFDENGQRVFKPEDKVTRAQFIKMLVLALGLADESATSDFKDVNPADWYYQYISSAKQYGIVNGRSDGTFGVDNHITREEMAVMAYRAVVAAQVTLPKDGEDAGFDDLGDRESYAVESIIAMQKAKIINGMGDKKFAPKENSNRAQAAKIIFGLMQAAGK